MTSTDIEATCDDDDKLSPRIDEEDPAVVMRRLMAANPNLSYAGMGIGSVCLGHRPSKEQQREEHEENRAKLLHPDTLRQFSLCRVWLRQWPRTKHVNKRGTSYGLKHVAEADIGYISNGTFIAAALAEGFLVVPDDPWPWGINAWINISHKAWRVGEGFFA